MIMDFQAVLQFWFHEITPEQWWKKDIDFDNALRAKFLNLHRQATLGELEHWRKHADGALAEIIVLDQFSRNMFRGTPESFASDPQALCLAQFAIKARVDQKLSDSKRAFLYMPFMHSESRIIHEVAVTLFAQLPEKDNLTYELAHKSIIDRFGRYPHRNHILGRESTEEELAFLQEEGSSF